MKTLRFQGLSACQKSIFAPLKRFSKRRIVLKIVGLNVKDTLPRFLSHYLPSRYVAAYGFFDSLQALENATFSRAFCIRKTGRGNLLPRPLPLEFDARRQHFMVSLPTEQEMLALMDEIHSVKGNVISA